MTKDHVHEWEFSTPDQDFAYCVDYATCVGILNADEILRRLNATEMLSVVGAKEAAITCDIGGAQIDVDRLLAYAAALEDDAD